jgi:hypothetical protein
MQLLGVFASTTIFATTSLSLASGALDEWHWRNPNPNHGNLFTGIEYVNGSFMGMAGGSILISQEGTNYGIESQGSPFGVRSITYGGGTYVAVGAGRSASGDTSLGLIVTSQDGLTWSEPILPANVAALVSVAYGGGVFVAVGPKARERGNLVLTSGDGITWQLTAESFGLSNDWQCVTYGNGTFVVVGMNLEETGDSPVLTSSDGVHWTPRISGTHEPFNSVVYGQGLFVAVGTSLAVSSNGIIWTNQSLGLTLGLESIAYGAGRFVAVGYNGLIMSSPDGGNWSRTQASTANALRTVAYGNNLFVAAGFGTLLTSADGTRWTTVANLRTPPTLQDIVYGTGRFIAVGQGGATWTSPDGTQWMQGVSGATNDLNRVAFGNNMFVAVGAGGTILRSGNGTDWSRSDSGITADLGLIGFGNGTFVARAGGSVFLTSPDGISWHVLPTGLTNVAVGELVYGNGAFVALGAGLGVALRSSDGIHWTAALSGSMRSLFGLAYGNGRFVGLGHGFTQTSTNGLDWDGPWFTTNAWNLPSRISYGGGTFMTVSQVGTILTSPNGLQWQARNSGTAMALNAAAYGQGSFVAVGGWGTIVQSGQVAFPGLQLGPLVALPGRTYGFSISGSVGQTWQVEGSVDLVNWLPISSFVSTNAVMRFVDSAATNFEQRFYRVIGQ